MYEDLSAAVQDRINRLKEEVMEAALSAEEGGLCRRGGGNFSQIDRESGLVVITPSGENRKAYSAQDLPVIDGKGRIAENPKGYRPSSEAPMHLEIYRRRPDISAVCHTHAPNASAFACAGFAEVKPILFESLMYGGICRVTDFAAPGSEELGRRAAEGLEGTFAVILGNHGLVTVGDGIGDALLKTRYVEDVCLVSLKAAAAVGYENVRCFSEEELRAMLDKYGFGA